MAKEEIIIDGVDVAKCIYYRRIWGNDYNYCNIHNNSCHDSSDCYYKQLKRLEQENAILKEKIQIAQRHIEILGKCLDTKEELCAFYRDENEQLKTKLKILENK